MGRSRSHTGEVQRQRTRSSSGAQPASRCDTELRRTLTAAGVDSLLISIKPGPFVVVVVVVIPPPPSEGGEGEEVGEGGERRGWTRSAVASAAVVPDRCAESTNTFQATLPSRDQAPVGAAERSGGGGGDICFWQDMGSRGRGGEGTRQ